MIYGPAKNVNDKLAVTMAHELREHNVAVVLLYPGLVRTEAVMMVAKWFDLSNSESPQFQGRGVAALAADLNVIGKSGKPWITAALAQEYAFVDVDGKQPCPITVAEV